jgi:hypothetical protein
MTEDVPRQFYRGVQCMSCRQPIPLPAIVIALVVLPQRGEDGSGTAPTERAFTLRCRACNREKPYRSVDIVEFEGAPRARVSYLRGPQRIRHQHGGLSRAANG